MRAVKLSELLYENPFNLEGYRNTVQIYNLNCGNVKTDEFNLSIDDIDRVFEDFDMICDTYDLRGIYGSSAYHLGLIRDIPLPRIEYIRKKGSNGKLPLPFTVEQLIDYLYENGIQMAFEPTLVKHNFKQYWLL